MVVVVVVFLGVVVDVGGVWGVIVILGRLESGL